MANALQNSATFFFINETDLNSKQAGFYFVDGIVTTETKRNRTKILWAQCCLLDLNRSLKHQSCFGSAVFTYIKLRISLLVVKYFPHLSIIQHHLPSSGWERERKKSIVVPSIHLSWALLVLKVNIIDWNSSCRQQQKVALIRDIHDSAKDEGWWKWGGVA